MVLRSLNISGSHPNQALNVHTREGRVLVPPINFSLVAQGIYRSGHPNKKNFPFLRRLGLKGIIYLCSPRPSGVRGVDIEAECEAASRVGDDKPKKGKEGGELEGEVLTYRKDSLEFVREGDIKLWTFNLTNESDLFLPSSSSAGNEDGGALEVLKLVLDTSNHPLLIHDDMGKGTANLICALIRRMQSWSLTGIFAEGDLFAGPAGGAEGGGLGEAGMEYIASFEPRKFQYDKTHKPNWVD